MSQIPILSGIYTDENAEFRASYPLNLVPVAQETGISSGYLRPADGIVPRGTGPGIDRGGINWNGVCYRVMGNALVRVDSDGTVDVLGAVPGSTVVSMDYSFDRLAIASDQQFYLFDGTSIVHVTDPDLGAVNDFIWVDGYFMTTDGTNLVVTELTDPTSVNPLKYGSAEDDPDPIVAILKYRDEPAAIGRYTIEFYQNVGGDFFPFQRIEGATINRGSIGTHSCCLFLPNDTSFAKPNSFYAIAFLGSGRNEPPAVWMGANGQSVKVSTREVDTILSQFTEAELAQTIVESRPEKGLERLYIHLPDRTLVYDAGLSRILQQNTWYVLSSAITGFSQYRARNFIWCYDQWLLGDPQSNAVGSFTISSSSHWGQKVGWEFNTGITYNESKGAIFNEMELVGLTGCAPLGLDGTIYTSYSVIGKTWSQERSLQVGKQGEYEKRLLWLNNGMMRNWRIQKFRGTTDAMFSIARLEVKMEPLAA